MLSILLAYIAEYIASDVSPETQGLTFNFSIELNLVSRPCRLADHLPDCLNVDALSGPVSPETQGLTILFSGYQNLPQIFRRIFLWTLSRPCHLLTTWWVIGHCRLLAETKMPYKKHGIFYKFFKCVI